MDNENKNIDKSRRNFLNLAWMEKNKIPVPKDSIGNNSQKMLTADGQLVEVDLSEKLVKKSDKKASNKEILDWLNQKS